MTREKRSLREVLPLASMVANMVAVYDPMLPRNSEMLIRGWAEQLALTNLEDVDLKEGVLRAYRGQELPANRIGTIIFEATEARKVRLRSSVVRDLQSGGEVQRKQGPVLAAYESTGALGVACPECAADAGSWCARNGRTTRIPHVSRIALAKRGG
ncbi:hypothetical protein [Corynebacterium argentoratense]|uniref:zinc finger domain-containing protein n=1 Tax=Corynebacterium argentoratense TaxID=42817 RepID=UPI001F366B8D|nr:hypothetical protein [Corynebacterium argentoratense]MCF1694279.1 hypothetical protein [Corynebacterium argentoratense]MCF1735850.1 hypothetical protein [Corynebacterium argentoratense]